MRRRTQVGFFVRSNLIAAASPGLGNTCDHPVDEGIGTTLMSGNLKTGNLDNTIISGTAALG